MKPDKSLFLILLFFLLLSILASWQSIIDSGNFVYRDATTVVDMQAYRDNFLSLYKNYNLIDFDFYKRIPESWIYLFTDLETYDRIKFTLIPFAVLVISFFVGEKILEESGVKGNAKRLIAVAFALIYLFNPITLQVFLKYYPMINVAVFPLFFYFTYNSLSKLSMKSAILAGLLAGFMFLMVVHALLYLMMAVPLAVLAALKGRNPLKLIPILAVLGLVFLFSTAFVTSPYLVTTAIKSQHGFHALSHNMLDTFSQAAYLPAPILMDYTAFWWPWVDYQYPAGQAFFLLTFVFAAVLFIFGLSDRNPWSIMASLGLVIVFFLSKGSGSPFGSIYEILNFDVPVVGWLMRVPNKFLHLVPFFTSLIFLRFCVTAHKKNDVRMKAFALLSIPLLLFLSWPYLTGDIDGSIQKRDYTHITNDLTEINEILGGNSSVVAYGIHKSGSKDLYGNVFSIRTFLHREIGAYRQNSNYSGMSAFGSLGVEYAMVGGEENTKYFSKSFESVYDGEIYSLFRISNKTSDVTIPSNVYASYASYEAVRSLMREPPENSSMDMVLFPMAFLDYNSDAVNAADTIVLDSAPVLSQTYDSGLAFTFYRAAKSSSSRNGWAGLSPTSYDDKKKSPFRTWDHHFEAGFAATYRDPVRTGRKEYKTVMGTEDFALSAVDTISSVNGSEVTIKAGKTIYTATRAPINLETGSDYRVQFYLEEEVDGMVDAELFLQDAYGDIIDSVPLLSIGPNVSEEFTIPPETAISTILFTARSNGNRSTYSIHDFKIEKLAYEKNGPRIQQSFEVQNTSDYDVYLRMYKGPYAGSMRLYLDGKELYTMKTQANISHFYWEKIYSGELSKGSHNLGAESLGGYNALNIGYVLPKGTPSPDWEDKTFLFRLTGLGDFGNSNYRIVQDSTSSTFYLANSTMALSSPFEVISGGQYTITSSIRGEHKILLDMEEVKGSVNLEPGNHLVQVVPLKGSIAVDHVTLTKNGKGLNNVTGFSYVKNGPSEYTVTANSAGPFFVSLNRGFSPVWLAETDEGSYRPFASYFSINGFLINESGPTTVKMEFEPQRFSNLWALLGAIGILAVYLLSRRFDK